MPQGRAGRRPRILSRPARPPRVGDAVHSVRSGACGPTLVLTPVMLGLSSLHVSMPSGHTLLFEACGPALVLTPAIRPKRRRAPWPAGTRQKRTHKAPVGQFRGEATPGAVLGASPVVNVSSRALGPPPPPLPEGRRGAGRQGGARQRRRVCRRRRGEGRGRAAGIGVSHGPVRRRGLRGVLVQGRRGRAAGRRS